MPPMPPMPCLQRHPRPYDLSVASDITPRDPRPLLPQTFVYYSPSSLKHELHPTMVFERYRVSSKNVDLAIPLTQDQSSLPGFPITGNFRDCYPSRRLYLRII
jgi:hypothetical protein